MMRKVCLKSMKIILKIITSILILSCIVWIYNTRHFEESILNTEYKSSKNFNVNVARPVIVWWTHGFPNMQFTLHCSNNVKCELVQNNRNISISNAKAFLFYGSNINFTDLPLPRRPSEIIWGLYHEESPRNVAELMHEPVLNMFNYSSTFSRHSDVPFPLQYLEDFKDITSTKYFVPTKKKNSLLKEISPILFLQSDCDTSTEREEYVKELMKFIKIDSYGACVNNKQLPDQFKEDYLNNLNDEEFLRFIARYKFVIAIENGVCNDYITEKFWRAIKVGSVPIYFGSPSIRDWLPNEKSSILLENFPTPKQMSDHLKELLKNDSLYEQYLEHKTKQVITNQRLIIESNKKPNQSDSVAMVQRFNCLICEKLHDKKTSNNGKNIVNTSHYDCPKPISALTMSVNPENDWVYSWVTAKENAARIYKKIIGD